MNEATEIRNRKGELIDFTFEDAGRKDYLVVLGHGVTGNKDRPNLVHLAGQLSANSWPSIRISFSGNGASEGSFEESTISKELEDLQDVLATVAEGRKVIYVGHSMGGAVGVLAAASCPSIVGLVSLAGMVFTKRFCEVEFGDEVPGEGFMWGEKDCPLSEAYLADLGEIGDVLSAAAQIQVPWLLVHGSEDDLVPLRDSEAAKEATNGPVDFEIIEGADHVFSAHLEPMSKAVLEWLDKHFT